MSWISMRYFIKKKVNTVKMDLIKDNNKPPFINAEALHSPT